MSAIYEVQTNFLTFLQKQLQLKYQRIHFGHQLKSPPLFGSYILHSKMNSLSFK